MKILLLSAYDAVSHAYWRESLYLAFPSHHWTTLTLPPRYFPWRIRGNGMSWHQEPTLRQDYDLCMVTSMVDLATLRGLVPHLASIPTVLYFHENQFAYPLSDNALKHQQVGPQFVQIYSALAADMLCFNSDFNRQTFLLGCEALLKKMPDEVPPGLGDTLRLRSRVVPVGLTPVAVETVETQSNAHSLVWNHRWEYDKGPERLLAFVQALPADLALTFHIVGQSFRSLPPAFAQLKALLNARGWLGQWGYVESKEAYLQLLAQSRYVISTSEHDFQGLAILEAVQCGCIPILPARMAYPEFFAREYLYASKDGVAEEAQAMVGKALALFDAPETPVPDISSLVIDAVKPDYQGLWEELLRR